MADAPKNKKSETGASKTKSSRAPVSSINKDSSSPDLDASELSAKEWISTHKEKDLPPSKDTPRQELADRFTPFVRSIAGRIKKTLPKEIEFGDLISYGMLGLFEAADRYDPNVGASFMTFAYYRIRGAIYDGLRGMGWINRSEYQKHRFEEQANAYISSVQEQAARKGVPLKKSEEEEVNALAEIVEGLATVYVTALDAMEDFDVADEQQTPADEALEMHQAKQIVAEAIKRMPPQESELLRLYYYKEMSLEEVGKQLGLSKSWTSRLHARAIDKLSRLLRDLVHEYKGNESFSSKHSMLEDDSDFPNDVDSG